MAERKVFVRRRSRGGIAVPSPSSPTQHAPTPSPTRPPTYAPTPTPQPTRAQQQQPVTQPPTTVPIVPSPPTRRRAGSIADAPADVVRADADDAAAPLPTRAQQPVTQPQGDPEVKDR